MREFRANLAKCIGQLDEDERPLVITRGGKAAAVLVHPRTLDELEDERELVGKVLRGLRELEDGDLVEDEEVWKDVDGLLGGGVGADEGEVDSRRAG